MSLYKAENMKLKAKISQLEERMVGIIGAIKIFSSGMEGREHEMNNQIANLLLSSSELKIVAPYITKEYAIVLQDRAKNGVKIQIVLNDRRLWPTEHENIYDMLKNTRGIDLVNNPNVKYLLVWTPKSALFTSGPLDKRQLMKTVLIGTIINQERKLHDLHEIFKEMLPSFMR
jgi:hypothetical protein